jgi:hypothetical protein
MKNKNTPVDYGTYVNELDMFASEWVNGDDKKWSNNNNEVGDNYGSFVAGYNKAKETLYTEEQVMQAIYEAHYLGSYGEPIDDKDTEIIIQSLKQK